MKTSDKETMKLLIHEVNSPKHELIRLMDRIEELHPAKARKLGAIIGKLESWQNSK